MEKQTYMTIESNKNFIGICIFKNKNYILSKDFFDTDDLDKLKSLVYKFDVDICFIDLSFPLTKFDSLHETGIEIKITKKYQGRKKEPILENYDLATISLFKMCSLLNELDEKHQFEINDRFVHDLSTYKKGFLRKIGIFSNYIVYVINESENMSLGYNSIRALNIFEEKSHPNVFIKSKKNSKSLFGFIDHCETKSGRNLLKYFVSFPFIDKNSIEKRKTQVDFILKGNYENYISKCLKNCLIIDKDIQTTMKMERKNFFMRAKKCIESAYMLIEILFRIFPFEFEFDLSVFDRIDYKGDFIFLDGFNERLDEFKNVYNSLSSHLNEVGNKIRYEEDLEISIIYFPQIGYLIETKNETRWELKFKIADKFYYKNEVMYSLDENVGDIKTRINEIEMDEAEKIAGLVYEIMPSLKNYLAFIDAINSLAIAARKNDMVMAETVDGNLINLENFRYLNEKYTQTLEITDNLIITGPNGSGKSALMRCIAHTIILNQIGSFVPCKSAKLGIFDGIFVKFNGYENMSSLKCDLIQMQNAINNSTESSLVLIDEFGKGTDVYDGVSLLMSVMENFTFPRVLITTHYQNFFLNSDEKEKIEDGQKSEKDFSDDPVLSNFKFICLKSPEKFSYKIFKGVYNESVSVELLKKHGFENEFIKKFEDNKTNKNHEKYNDNEWASKVVADFLLD